MSNSGLSKDINEIYSPSLQYAMDDQKLVPDQL